MRRLMSLDFVLEHPGLNWLPTEPEKVEFFEGLGIRSRLVPRRIYYGDEGAKKRYFSLKLPIAGGADTVTFAYVDPGRESTGELNTWGPRMFRFGMRSAPRGDRSEWLPLPPDMNPLSGRIGC